MKLKLVIINEESTVLDELEVYRYVDLSQEDKENLDFEPDGVELNDLKDELAKYFYQK